MTEYHLAVRRGRAGCGERAAVHRLGCRHGARLGIRKSDALQARARCLEGGVQRFDLGPGVEGNDVHQIEGAAFETSARGSGTVSDASHFLEVLRFIPAQKESVDE